MAVSSKESDIRPLHPGVTVFTEEDKEKLLFKIKKYAKHSSLSILCGGSTGVGKTTLISGLLGTSLFGVDTGEKPRQPCLNPDTLQVREMTFERNGVTVTVWDTPGFEGKDEKDERYCCEIKKKCSNFDLFLYCIDGSKDRSTDLVHEKSSFKKYTELFGVTLWKRTVIVLTKMNLKEAYLQDDLKDNEDLASLLQKKIKEWQEEIQKRLKLLPGADKYKVPIIPAGDGKSPVLAGQSENWFTELFEAILERLPFRAMLALLQLNDKRLKTPTENTDIDSTKLPLSDQPIVISNKTVKIIKDYFPAGTGIVGTAVGAGVGATIGALLIGLPTFGTFAAVGLAGGAVIGGIVGGGGVALITQIAVINYIKKKLKKSTERF